jgi:putative hemolysin
MDALPAEAIDPGRALRAIPPLIKAYLRLGGFVGEGAFIDLGFNTIDVCLVMDTGRMQARHRAFYERNRGSTG